MKKVYTVKNAYSSVEVLAESFGEADSIFKKKYPDVTITAIECSKLELLLP